MDWARTIRNETTRTGEISQVYRQWKRKDPKAAEAALNASGLPPQSIRQITQHQAQPGPVP